MMTRAPRFVDLECAPSDVAVHTPLQAVFKGHTKPYRCPPRGAECVRSLTLIKHQDSAIVGVVVRFLLRWTWTKTGRFYGRA